MKSRIELNTGWAEWDDTYVQVGDRALPERIEVTMPGSVDLLPALSMTIEVLEGVPRCTALTISAQAGGREVRSGDLRAVPIERLVEDISTWASGDVISSDSGAAEVRRTVGSVNEARDRSVRREIQEVRANSRRAMSDDLLRSVAEVYRQHAEERPVEAVRRAFATSHRTAARYVSLARSRGYLPPTTAGKVTI